MNKIRINYRKLKINKKNNINKIIKNNSIKKINDK